MDEQLLQVAAQAHTAKDYAKACFYYRLHLAAHPDDGHTQYLYGTALISDEQPGLAIVYLKRAVVLRPDNVAALSNLGAAYRMLGRAEQSEEVLRRAIEAGKRVDLQEEIERLTLSDAYNNLGALYHSEGRNKEAEAALDRAIELSPQSGLAHWNRGLVYLITERWAEGAKEYDWGYQSGERKITSHVYNHREWLNEDLAGRTILVWGEQGIGDEILFAGCLPDLAAQADRVIFDCHPRLAKIFARSFPDVEIVGRRKDAGSRWSIGAGVDYHVPAGSLMAYFRNKPEDFPVGAYLKADDKRVQWWRDQAPGFRIGLSWRGGKGDQGEPHRSIPLADLPFVQPIPGVEWISLQYGNHYTEIAHAEKRKGVKIHTHEFAMEDYTETANLVHSCDLVISVVTAAVHLAGALGTPALVMVPKNAPWKFVHKFVMPWHKSVRQFHQETPLEWADVLRDVEKSMQLAIKGKK